MKATLSHGSSLLSTCLSMLLMRRAALTGSSHHTCSSNRKDLNGGSRVLRSLLLFAQLQFMRWRESGWPTWERFFQGVSSLSRSTTVRLPVRRQSCFGRFPALNLDQGSSTKEERPTSGRCEWPLRGDPSLEVFPSS